MGAQSTDRIFGCPTLINHNQNSTHSIYEKKKLKQKPPQQKEVKGKVKKKNRSEGKRRKRAQKAKASLKQFFLLIRITAHRRDAA